MSRIHLFLIPLLIGIALIGIASAEYCFTCAVGESRPYFNPAAGPSGPSVFPEYNFTPLKLTFEDYQHAASMRAQRAIPPAPAWDRLPTLFDRPSLPERFSGWFTGS
ncbi:hypothetical protein ASZ90_015492 [hydrocarbon metagenome]|uniref:Uncharacterized protein n=1 Tax=hydrocarbon metagenome TaxID=938273 RepID=A0A0W8F235_9ZZZZ